MVFVGPGGGSTNCGSRTSPCGSIAAALGKGTRIAIASGTYDETIDLRANVRLCGGYDPSTWQAGGPPSRIVPSKGAAGVTVLGSDQRCLVLDALEVIAPPPADAGASTYGVFASSEATTLCLRNTAVVAGNAASGRVGADGPDGAAPPSCPSDGDGGMGAAGAAGTGSLGGRFTNQGWVPGDGANGSAGSSAAHGELEQSYCTESTCPKPNTCACDVSGCGGSGCVTVLTQKMPCPTDVRRGCGGGGGGEGLGGGGGGASVGVFASGTQVVVSQRSSIAAASGGSGAVGGKPGVGGRGTTGDPGHCTTCADGISACGPTEDVAQAYLIVGSASPGGTGGAGGGGGGGAGGASCALFTSDMTRIFLDGGTVTHGEGGAGAAGAASGAAFSVCTLDGGVK